MTTILTSSYSAWRPELGAPVVTSLTIPKPIPEAASWPRCELLTPRWSYFRAPAEQFDEAYLEQLDRYGVQRIARRLADIAREYAAERLVILCFEVVPNQCHRRLWAEWWRQTGEVVEEVSADQTLK